MSSLTMASMPQEILEHIAYLSGTDRFLGPPTTLSSLVAVNHDFYERLSLSRNRNLYARIFAFKFDTTIAIRRFGEDLLTQKVLAQELQRRFTILKRIRARSESNTDSCDPETLEGSERLRETIYHAYLLLLENAGKNEQQLRDFAGIGQWLHEYWFTNHGSSLAVQSLSHDDWPGKTEEQTIAMWLLCFMLQESISVSLSGNVFYVLQIYALGAPEYQLASPSWTSFIPSPRAKSAKTITHYSKEIHLTTPPLASPAILNLLTIVQQASTVQLRTDKISKVCDNSEAEWNRCVILGEGSFGHTLTPAFTPKSLEGAWEGIFTYIDFSVYATLLSGGAPPSVLKNSLVVKHRQTWILREHHLLVQDPGVSGEPDSPVSPGDPLRSYFPLGCQITEDERGVEVFDPSANRPVLYRRASVCQNRTIQDIILTGEGHSAWGQFSLVGRVRPSDGFINLAKDYVNGERGKWIYRGYLIGGANGHLSGRWRDSLSPAPLAGYEGCFTLSRRG